MPEIQFKITDEEFYQIVSKIAKRIAKKYVYGFLDEQDLEQECFLLAREALPRFNGTSPLENFLTSHLRNRLSNMKRDNFSRLDSVIQKIQEDKRALMEPLDISLISPEDESSLIFTEDVLQNIRNAEIIEAITPHIGPGYKRLYKRFIQTGKIVREKRSKFIEHIRELIVKYGKGQNPS